MKSILAKAIPLTVAVSMMSAVPAFAYEKNETVYTKIDADGKITYQSVNEHITSNHKETINDYSDLSDIVNTSGNEKLNEVEEGYVSYRDGSRSSYHLHTCISSSVQFRRHSESSWNSSYRRLIITLQN